MTDRNGTIAFLITDISSGGIVARLQKWTAEFILRGFTAEVHTLHDRSSVYTPKIGPETFPSARLIRHEFDSLDKRDRITRELMLDESLVASRAVVSSTFTRAGLLVRALRNRNWRGCYLEIVPSDHDDHIRPFMDNLQTCDVIGTVSTDIAAKLKHVLPAKPIVVVPGGINVQPLSTDRTHPGATDNPFRICYAGRMDPVQKRIFDLPAIAARLSDAGIKCQWILAGKGSHAEELKRRFAELDLRPPPEFTGQLDAGELRRQLTQSHAFVLPSAFEGLSNALCEASEAGAVPLASRTSGTADVIDDGKSGFILATGDIDSFARRVTLLAGDERLWENMSKAARDKVTRDLSVSRSVETLIAAIEHREREATPPGVGRATATPSSPLESPLMPNAATRLLRKAWRTLRGKPRDVAPRKK